MQVFMLKGLSTLWLINDLVRNLLISYWFWQKKMAGVVIHIGSCLYALFQEKNVREDREIASNHVVEGFNGCITRAKSGEE